MFNMILTFTNKSEVECTSKSKKEFYFAWFSTLKIVCKQ